MLFWREGLTRSQRRYLRPTLNPYKENGLTGKSVKPLKNHNNPALYLGLCEVVHEKSGFFLG